MNEVSAEIVIWITILGKNMPVSGLTKFTLFSLV